MMDDGYPEDFDDRVRKAKASAGIVGDGDEPPSAAKPETRKQAPSGSKAKPRFVLQAFADISVDVTRRGYLVKNLLASTGLAVIWGPPKCGKSFWAVDLGLHIALGREYRGRRVQQVPVVYVALEGQQGMPARIEAFRRHHNVADAPFYLVMSRLNLIADYKQLVSDIKAQIPNNVTPGVVFVDTLNRSLVGSESKDEDMAKYLAAAEYVAAELEAAVAIVHHCGIDATRPRGHTSLTGSVESQLAVKRGEAGQVIVTVEYAKDFAEGAEIISELEQVTIGIDPDGDEITTLVVVPSDRQTKSAGRVVKGQKKVALDLLKKAIAEAGEVPPASNHIPPYTRAVPDKTWLSYVKQGSFSDSDDPDNIRRAFVRVSKELQAAKMIGVWGGYAWIA
jgi:AAA domain